MKVRPQIDLSIDHINRRRRSLRRRFLNQKQYDRISRKMAGSDPIDILTVMILSPKE